MNKTIFIIVILALAVAVGVFYSVKFAPRAIETVLPGNAVAYVKVSDIGKQVDEFKSSRLWKNIKNINVEMLMEKSVATKDQIERYKTSKSEMTSFLGNMVIEKYFGKEIAIAMYPSQVKDISPDTFLDTASNITLVTRVKPETDFIDFISKILNKAGKKYEVVEENYNGRKITLIKLGDKVSLTYVRIKDLLVICIGKKGAISCCDAADKKSASLAQDKNYIAAMSKLPKGADTVAYGNMKLIISGFRQFILSASRTSNSAGRQEAFQSQINKTLDMYAGFKTFSYARYPGKIVKERMTVCIDRSKLFPFFKGFYSIVPRKDMTLKLAPAQTIYYAWGTFDSKGYWNYMRSALEEETAKANQGQLFKDAIAGFEKQTGMSVDNEIVPAIGDEGGAFLTDINLDGMIPMPEFVVFAKINKKQTIDKLVNNLLKDGGKSESYKGVDIKYLDLPFGLNFQPAFCYAGDYFLFSLGRNTIKASIDSYTGASKSIMENKDFMAVNHGLMDPNNQVVFVKTDVLLQKVKGICDWGIRWLSFMAEQQRKYQQMMDAQTDKLKTDIGALEKEIGEFKAERANALLTPEDIKKIDEQIEDKEAALTMKGVELDQLLVRKQKSKSPLSDIDTSLVQLYLDKAVYPILDGLQSLKAMGSKTVFNEDTLQTEVFSKIENK